MKKENQYSKVNYLCNQRDIHMNKLLQQKAEIEGPKRAAYFNGQDASREIEQIILSM